LGGGIARPTYTGPSSHPKSALTKPPKTTSSHTKADIDTNIRTAARQCHCHCHCHCHWCCCWCWLVLLLRRRLLLLLLGCNTPHQSSVISEL
jgi:hypothetical protein